MRGSHHGRIEEVAYQDRRPKVNHCKHSQGEQSPYRFPEDGYRAADGQASAKFEDGEACVIATTDHADRCVLNSSVSLGTLQTEE
jgi:hypothetical protein